MQFMLVLYSDETRWPTFDAAQQAQAIASYAAFTEALRKADAFRSSGRLRPTSTGATVRVTDAGAEVLDGPYADTKEQLAGFFLIEAADLDAAIAWAARCPAASHGTVEVLPLWA